MLLFLFTWQFYAYVYIIQFILVAIIGLLSLPLENGDQSESHGDRSDMMLLFTPLIGMIFLPAIISNVLYWSLKNFSSIRKSTIDKINKKDKGIGEVEPEDLRDKIYYVVDFIGLDIDISKGTIKKYSLGELLKKSRYFNRNINNLYYSMNICYKNIESDKITSLFISLIEMLYTTLSMLESSECMTKDMKAKINEIIKQYNVKMTSIADEIKEKERIEEEKRLKRKQDIVNQKLDETLSTMEIMSRID